MLTQDSLSPSESGMGKEASSDSEEPFLENVSDLLIFPKNKIQELMI